MFETFLTLWIIKKVTSICVLQRYESSTIRLLTFKNGSLMHNLKYANQYATDEVHNACRSASIYDKIMTFPAGYETRAGDRNHQCLHVVLSSNDKQPPARLSILALWNRHRAFANSYLENYREHCTCISMVIAFISFRF